MLRRSSTLTITILSLIALFVYSCKNDPGAAKESTKDTTGLVLPTGFRAEIVADAGAGAAVARTDEGPLPSGRGCGAGIHGESNGSNTT